MTDIFISYSRKDKPWVKTLASSLEAEGYDVWWDPEILPGQDYENVIKNALASTKCVVTVWSTNSISSTWVKAESNKGLERHIYVPVLHESVEPPMQFGHIQSANLTSWKGKTSDQRYQQLLRAIALHTSKEPPPPPPIRSNKWKWIVGSLTLAVLAGGGYMNYKPQFEPSVSSERGKSQNPIQVLPITSTEKESETARKAKEIQLADQKAVDKKAKADQFAAQKLAKKEKENIAEEKQREAERIAREKSKEEAEKKAKEEAKKLAEEKAIKEAAARKEAKQKAKQKAGQERLAKLAKFIPEMVSIPAGSFKMGCVSGKDCGDDEKPVHPVKISAFSMSKYEITFKQWDQCVKDKGCTNKAKDEGWGREDRPVINVSWKDAQEYVKWLSKKTGDNYRLPTEAEWEYAARAETSTVYPWGDKASHTYANYGTDKCCNGLAEGKDKWVNTAPVGSFKVNKFGLHDMHGNVWEWVQDCYHESYKGAPDDGLAWEDNCYKYDSGTIPRILRGGSWLFKPNFMRSAYRVWNYPAYRIIYYGFRVARTP